DRTPRGGRAGPGTGETGRPVVAGARRARAGAARRGGADSVGDLTEDPARRPASRILRVTGPLVEAEYTGGVAMYDLVSVGPAGLRGEVVAISGEVITIQAYEYTGGLAPGHPALPQGRPLSVRLGHGLLGGVFDGLLRPLSAAGDWLLPGTHRRTAGAG